MATKVKTRRQLRVGSGFWNRLCAGSSLVQRVQHDRRPATGVVVMPVSMMVATCAEHCPGLIPDEPDSCQYLRARHKWPCLDDVNLPLHVRDRKSTRLNSSH